MDHTKIVMPIVLVVCVLVTVFFAINANRREKLEKEAEMAAANVVQEAEADQTQAKATPAPVFELEKNAYPEVNDMLRTYYDAQASGDIEVVSALNTYLNEIEKIRVEELSKYIEEYPVLDVYTKPGLEENTYVAYVYSEVKFNDIDQQLPGMQTYYIGKNENNEFFINDGTYDDSVWNYIKEVTLQDDVVDLNNKVVVEYNEFLASDEELNEFVAYLKEKINEEVGEILAKAEQPEAEEAAQNEAAPAQEEAQAQEGQEEGQQDGETTAPNVVQMAKATDVVNIRTSDSETADKIDKAQVGQEFKLLEQRGNGWSKVEYNGKEAFIKSDYLEVTSEVSVDVAQAEPENDTPQETASAQESLGTVKVKENVRVRKSASTESESLGTAYVGEKLELLMKQADGWTRVKYNGETGYVKSDYVE
ncbi:MAG: SH3 domain-containing protein [Lachnospiraceae bacterium]|nr:SH3 domain-containing protein [Lachnospiraceae bacterium]